MIETKDLQLVVERQVEGELLTNAVKIRDFVLERVKDYTPENYVGKVKEAKDDRAELNKAAKELNDKRIELERQFMAPFMEFKAVIGETVTAIKDASGKVGEVISEVEQQEREQIRAAIQAAYEESGFDLVPLERIMDQRWLNKSTSEKKWRAELAEKIRRIENDLASLGSVEFSDDARAFYLDTLDIGQALQHAQKLKQQREALQEQERRDAERAKESQQTAHEPEPDAPTEDAQPFNDSEPDPEERYTFVIEITGTREQLAALRQCIDENGIEYRKVDEAV